MRSGGGCSGAERELASQGEMAAADLLPLLLALHVASSAGFEQPTRVVNDISWKIAEAMLECAKQMYPGFNIDKEMSEYWNLDNDVVNIKWGCIAVCSMDKLKLCHEDGQLNETNVKRMILANGADDTTMKVLLDVFRNCHQHSYFFKKSCGSGLEASKCFRGVIARLTWIPNF